MAKDSLKITDERSCLDIPSEGSPTVHDVWVASWLRGALSVPDKDLSGPFPHPLSTHDFFSIGYSFKLRLR